ncbi:MAG: hypothetical protein GF398_04645 [Chitinivibrionales bacterium]|nr:hypothetical protein [Chitinivibrionales bacterium]
MKYRWENDKPQSLLQSLCSTNGSALYIVLIFSVVVFVAGSTYLWRQFAYSQEFQREPKQLQALLNARSGIWKGLEMLEDTTLEDTLSTIDGSEVGFGAGLFDESADSINFLEGMLTPDGTPVEVQPYLTDSYGYCDVALVNRRLRQELTSVGHYEDYTQRVKVIIAGLLPFGPDTVLYHEHGTEPAGGMIEGRVVSVGQLSTTMPGTELDSALKIHKGELSEYVNYLQQGITDISDTLLPDVPLTIQYAEDFDKIVDVVNGPLFIDGGIYELEHRFTQPVLVLGDLQITGDVKLIDAEFTVTGEVKILDECAFENGSIFSQGTIFIGNSASFSGAAFALSKIIVYDEASVLNRSTLISYKKAKNTATNNNDTANIAEAGFASLSEAASTALDTTEKFLSIELANSVTMDGVIVAVGKPGGVKIDRGVVMSGVVWAEGMVCLEGEFYGVMKAKQLFNCRPEAMTARNSQQSFASQGQYQSTLIHEDGAAPDPGGRPPPVDSSKAGGSTSKQSPSELLGSIRALYHVRDYYLPFFMGTRSIIAWREQ